ncbi:MAG TPA: hypothetical protein VI980_03115 [Acidimicrobiia bacterium]|nr:hypothetical protein [Acidimicrobiia bacterium]HLF60153.1 hypothetical protein [Acidimicrobiia bacterium]
MLGRLARTFGRFVGLIFTLVGLWVVLANLVEHSYAGWTLAWIVVAGAAGAAGGITYLLSFDGPSPFRNRRARLAGWGGMLFLAVLPTSLSYPLFTLTLLTIPTLFLQEGNEVPKAASA